MTNSKNIETVLAILRDEVRGDIASARSKLTDDYAMTWMYQDRSGNLFPTTTQNLDAELQEAYEISGREYDIKNIAEGPGVVMIEFVESYPDPGTGRVYRTPISLVIELRDGKIRTGRHYCDPRLSYMHLSKQQIDAAFH